MSDTSPVNDAFADDEELKHALENCLDSVDGNGSFAAHMCLDDVNPGLVVDSLGSIGMPVSEHEVQRLIQVSRQSPFGKGEATIVDTSVRRTWEIDASKLGLTHPKWPTTHRNIVDGMCKALGVPNGGMYVGAQLYKLLIYEPGAMFKPHKDTEKAPRMFGTLVITLPCQHEGGDLQATFGGKTFVMKSCEGSQWSSKAFAWYADVLHEVKPVISGYRVALTYNLVHNGQSSKPTAVGVSAQHNSLMSTFHSWKSGIDSHLAERLIYLLEHKYTEMNLRLEHLKGADRIRVGSLLSAAEQSGFALLLCNVEKSGSGSVEDDGPYRSHRWELNDDDDDEDAPHIIEEVFDETLKLTRVVQLDGSTLSKNVDIDIDDVIQADPFEDRDCDDEDFEGFTGNEGAHTTQWYRDTGILIMPKRLVVDFVLENTGNIATILQQELENMQLDPSDSQQVEFVERIVHTCLRSTASSLWTSQLDLLLKASLAVSRQDLFLQILDRLDALPNDRALAVVADQIRQFGLDRIVRMYEIVHERRAFLKTLSQQLGHLNESMAHQLRDWTQAKLESYIMEKERLSHADITDIFSAVCEIGNRNDRLASRTLQLLRKQQSDTALLLDFMIQLEGYIQREQLDRDPWLEVLRSVAEMAASNFTLMQPRSTVAHSRYSYPNTYGLHAICPPRLPKAQEICKMLQLLTDFQMSDQYASILEKVAVGSRQLPPSILEDVVLPFLRDLIALNKRQGMERHSAGIRKLFTEAMMHYVRTALGVQPALPKEFEPRRFACGCHICKELERFLADCRQKTRTYQKYAKDRRHLESQLEPIRKESLIKVVVLDPRRRPQTIELTKLTGHYEFTQWLNARSTVCVKLTMVGTWDVLQHLLRDYFVDIMCMAKVIPRISFPERVPANLPGLAEPERSKAWIKECLVPDANAIIDKKTLWNTYTETMAAVPSRTPPLSIDSFLKVLPTAWAGVIVEGAESKLVKGVRRWERRRDGSTPDQSPYPCDAGPHARPPLAPVINPNEKDAAANGEGIDFTSSMNPLKRKIEVVDLCDSP